MFEALEETTESYRGYVTPPPGCPVKIKTGIYIKGDGLKLNSD